MRVLAIGDIHGCLRSLDALLQLVEPSPGDLLITLGDYIDRGPDSCGVLDRLLELRRRCRLITLCGNHEWMLLEARTTDDYFREWLRYGGSTTLESYPGCEPLLRLDIVPERHWRFLEGCIPYFETETHFFVHANVHPDLPLDQQTEDVRYWQPLYRDQRPHISGKVMICGHTSQRTGLPLDLGHAVCIDTWVYGQGWLTCLDVNTGQLWQANESGDTRIGSLEWGFPVGERERN